MSDLSYSGYRILVVEDTPQMARLTLITLERAGFTAFHAEDGEQAIQYLSQEQPDLILLDLNLPGISGWDVMDYLVGRYGAGTIPVIVTTAYGDTANRVVGKLQSVHRYLVKPFPPHELIQTMHGALNINA